MPDKLTAKERKARAAQKSRDAVKASTNKRRAGKVTTYVSQKARTPKKRGRPKLSSAFTPNMGKPKGLSPQAAFETLRPDCVSPLDWFRLFTPDESMWEALVEEAAEAVADGELPKYPDDAPANVSRRKLREMAG